MEADHPGNGVLIPCRSTPLWFRVGNDELYAAQTAIGQPAKEPGPEDLGLGGARGDAQNLAAAIGVDADSDYDGDTDDPTALPRFQVGGVDPQVGPWPSIGRLRNAWTRSSMSSHRRETWLFEMPVPPMALTRSSTERVETHARRPPGSLPPGPSPRCDAAPGSREVRALAQLRDRQFDPPDARLPTALPVAVSVIGPIRRSAPQPQPRSAARPRPPSAARWRRPATREPGPHRHPSRSAPAAPFSRRSSSSPVRVPGLATRTFTEDRRWPPRATGRALRYAEGSARASYTTPGTRPKPSKSEGARTSRLRVSESACVASAAAEPVLPAARGLSAQPGSTRSGPPARRLFLAWVEHYLQTTGGEAKLARALRLAQLPTATGQRRGDGWTGVPWRCIAWAGACAAECGGRWTAWSG